MATIDPTPEQLHANITGKVLRDDIHSPFNACQHRAGCQQTQAAFAALHLELDALRRDAARYRKWRAAYTSERETAVTLKMVDAWTPDQVDAVLDAAPAAG